MDLIQFTPKVIRGLFTNPNSVRCRLLMSVNNQHFPTFPPVQEGTNDLEGWEEDPKAVLLKLENTRLKDVDGTRLLGILGSSEACQTHLFRLAYYAIMDQAIDNIQEIREYALNNLRTCEAFFVFMMFRVEPKIFTSIPQYMDFAILSIKEDVLRAIIYVGSGRRKIGHYGSESLALAYIFGQGIHDPNIEGISEWYAVRSIQVYVFNEEEEDEQEDLQVYLSEKLPG